MIKKFQLAALLLGLLALACAAFGQEFEQGPRARNKRIFVPPVPGPISIDGDLKDWDLSGQIVIYATKETADLQSAKIALMHDDKALYISGEMRDPSPMMNRHDPQVDADKAWDADAFQLRLALDPKFDYPLNITGANDQLVHILLWNYTDKNEAELQIATGMNYAPRAGFVQGVAPHDSFQGVYKKSDDGRGYTFEYRIPWSTLGARQTPKAGDALAAAIQIQWGSTDGLSSAGGGWAMDLMNVAGFSFQSTQPWGRAILTGQNNLPRALVAVGDETPSGPPPAPLSFAYSLPRGGDVSIGIYDSHNLLVRQLLAQAPRKAGANLEKWDGLDDLGKPLAAGEYSWRGLVHDPITTRYVMGIHNSGQPSYPTADGRGAWGADHGQPRTACAAGDAMLLAWSVDEAGSGIIKTDLHGRKIWGIRVCATDLASDGQRFFAAGGSGFQDSSGVLVYSLRDGRPLNFGRGTPRIAEPAGGDKDSDIVTGLAYAKGVLFVSYAKRNLVARYDAKQGDIISTLAVPSPGALAVRSDGTVLVVSANQVLALRDGKCAPLVTTHLDQPQSIALDVQNIYVANQGALQNVSVFDANGRFLRAIGKRGGRPRVGDYQSNGMLEPGGIAIDKNQHLWVAETLDSPRRISVWNSGSGRLAREFFGASQYSTFVSMDPARPDEAYCHMTIWQVDLDKRTWKPKSTMWRPLAPNAIGAAYSSVRVFTARNGKQFAWGIHNYSDVLYQREGDVFKPILSGINVSKGNQFISWPPYPIFADNQKFPNSAYVWQDKNNDQTIQANEISAVPDVRGELLFNWVDADLNLYSDTGYVVHPVRFEKGGRPIYDFSKREKIGVSGSGGFGGLWVDPRDKSIYAIKDSGDGDPGLGRYRRDGSLLWRYRITSSWPQALSKPMARPGQVWGITAPLGVAGDITGVATYFGPFHLFTRDGLYVAMIFKDGRLGASDAETINCEGFSGQLVKMKNGNYYLLGGDTDGRVTEILGLDSIQRLPTGKLTLSAGDVATARAESEDYAHRAAGRSLLVIARGKNALSVAPVIHKTADQTHGFSAKAARDETNLYLEYSVESPDGLVNTIPDPRIVFTGGNLIDVQIATDAGADPNRTTPAPGDLRLLVSRGAEGKPLAVLFRPRIKGFTGSPEVLSSPTGKESFDAIETVSEKIGLNYTKTDKGFTVTVSIPLQLIGWQPRDASLVKMDVGYLFGNAGGNQIAQRLYWTNNSPTSGIIGDVPSESRLEPNAWGSVIVE